MKKLNKIVLDKATIMTVPEMKHITGGSYGDGGSCCFENFDQEGPCVSCGWSKSVAENSVVGHWCCDSCNSATWFKNRACKPWQWN